jgi:hypothetical protein
MSRRRDGRWMLVDPAPFQRYPRRGEASVDHTIASDAVAIVLIRHNLAVDCEPMIRRGPTRYGLIGSQGSYFCHHVPQTGSRVYFLSHFYPIENSRISAPIARRRIPRRVGCVPCLDV